MLDLAPHEAPEISNKSRPRRNSVDSQNGGCDLVASKPLDVFESAAARQNRGEEAHRLIDDRDLVRRYPTIRQTPFQNRVSARLFEKLER